MKKVSEKLPECHGIAITSPTPPESIAEAARYLLCRARETWPEAYVEDKAGEEYSHHSFALPAVFAIIADRKELPVGKDRKRETTPVLGVTISGRSVLLAFDPSKSPDVLAVAEVIANDPIWGPTWHPIITRYMT